VKHRCELRFRSHQAFTHASLSCILFCVSWAFLVCYKSSCSFFTLDLRFYFFDIFTNVAAELRDDRVRFILEADVISNVKTFLTSMSQSRQLVIRLIAELVKAGRPTSGILFSFSSRVVMNLALLYTGTVCFKYKNKRCQKVLV